MKRILEFFEDNDGRLSSNRLAFLCMSATVGLVWAYCSIKDGEPKTIHWSVVVLVATYMTGKLVQFGIESKTPPKEGG